MTLDIDGSDLSDIHITSAIVTGPTGAVGSALVRYLCMNKVRVHAVVRPDSARLSNLPDSDHLDIVFCGIDNLKKLPGMLVEKGICNVDAFFHLAWAGTTGESRNNARMQMSNIEYSIDAVEAAARLSSQVFVGAGSQAEYGRFEGKLAPDTPAFPETCYGSAKLCAGNMTRAVCQQKGIRHEWARILSVYGPCDTSRSMVMSVISDVLSGRNPSCTKGEQIWDYIYADDCARALVCMAERGTDGAVYSVGSGVGKELKEYISTICRIGDTGVVPNFGVIPYSENQVMYLQADTSALVEDTGFVCETSFEEGIQRTIEWYMENDG